MKFTKFLVCLTLVLTACSQSNTSSGSFSGIAGLSNGPTLPVITGSNVLPLTINGSTCSAANSMNGQLINKPCVSITICTTTNQNCQTIDDVLVDTGSYGLRVFKTVLNSNLTLTPVTSGGKTMTDCQRYGIGPGGTADWGEVATANVVLGGEAPVTMAIEIIDSTFAGKGSSVCSTDSSGDTFSLDSSPSQTGYNAIMGVGQFAADCGPDCADPTLDGFGQYFACSGTTCTGLVVPEASQVTNPVALLKQDNNGVLIRLPSIGLGGVPSLNGYLILGVGTQANNTMTPSANLLATNADQFGEIVTNFNGKAATGFLDTGTNAYAFDGPANLPQCSDGSFCPSSVVSLSAQDSAGSVSATIPFYIGNAGQIGPPNNVFIEFGYDDGGAGDFDWGLPFFIGRNVSVIIENQPSPLGTGPRWAF